MTVLAIAFSMFLGFLGGYFAARIAVDQAMHEHKKHTKELNAAVVEVERDIVGLENRIEQVEELILNQDDVRTTDGKNLNKNFEAIGDFIAKQQLFNTQVNQALFVLQHMNDHLVVDAPAENDIPEEEVIERIKEMMDEKSEAEAEEE